MKYFALTLIFIAVNLMAESNCQKLRWEEVHSSVKKPSRFPLKSAKLIGDNPVENSSVTVETRPSLWSLLRKIWFFLVPAAADELRIADADVKGLGALGDMVNGTIKMFLDMLTLWLYHDKESDCGKKLLCQVSREASHRGGVSSLATYASSMFVSFWLKDLKMTDSVQALKNGRRKEECTDLYPKCHLSL